MNGKQEASSRHLIDDCPERWESRVFICTYEHVCTHTHILSHTHTQYHIHVVIHVHKQAHRRTLTPAHKHAQTQIHRHLLAPEPMQGLGLPNCISENEKEETE